MEATLAAAAAAVTPGAAESVHGSAHGSSLPGSPLVHVQGSGLTSRASTGTRGSPTSADMEAWSSLEDIFNWVGLSPDAGPESPEGSYMEHMGFQVSTPIREIGMIDAADYNEAIVEWTIDGHRPPILLRSKAKSIGHLARVFLGREYTLEDNMAYDEKIAAHKRAVALRAAAPAATVVQAAAAAAPAPTANVRTAKFKDIADGMRAGEVAVLEPESHTECIDNYLRVMHAKRIPEAHEPTADQLSVLQAIIKEQSVPYVDFAIWGPYANRISKALSGTGLLFDADLKLTTVQFKGPPSFRHWKACWNVYSTAMIMLGAADPPALLAYADKVENLARVFTPVCWALIYQAETRWRREKLVHIQREEVRAYTAAQKDNRDHPYDPLRPWDRCYELATEGYTQLQYWYEAVERPAQLILSQTASVSDYLDGDAVIAASGSSHIATSFATPSDVGLTSEAPRPGAGKRKATQQDGEPPVKTTRKTEAPKERPKSLELHNVAAGVYPTNRNGRALCSAFQAGSCKFGTKCKNAHQCNKCLLPTHAGNTCKQTPKEKTRKSGGAAKKA